MSNGPNTTSNITFSGPAYQCAYEIVETLQKNGFLAYFAGGCVRDSLLGIPASDFDIATSATPQQVQQLFGGDRAWLVGAAFGVVCMPVRKGPYRGQVEVATFRSDGNYSDGRHPDQVTFTTPEHDAQRRDFTINGLFYDPIQKRVLDFVGGVEDLRTQRLRAIGIPYDRFQEDKLRLLRAIRFAARFHLQIDPQTDEAIRACAHQLAIVSVERIADEIRKMLASDWRSWAVQQLHASGLLQASAPLLSRAWSQQPSCMVASLAMLNALPNTDFACGWSALLLPIHFRHARMGWFHHFVQINGLDWASPTAIAQHWKELWKLANDESNDLAFYLEMIQCLVTERELPWSKVQPWLADRRAPKGLSLMKAFLQHDLQDQPAELRALWQGQLESFAVSLDWPREKLDPPPLLDGSDLKNLGLKPGRAFSSILSKIRELQLDQRLHGRSEALDWVIANTQPES